MTGEKDLDPNQARPLVVTPKDLWEGVVNSRNDNPTSHI